MSGPNDAFSMRFYFCGSFAVNEFVALFNKQCISMEGFVFCMAFIATLNMYSSQRRMYSPDSNALVSEDV